MISVIMLTYNREEYAWQMIMDIINQSYKDFEYIIINNGSTDETNRMIEKYKKLDNRIKVITLQQAHTIGKGRNVGLQNAEGDFIVFVDDDDRVDKDFLEFLVNLQREEQADIAMCGADEILNEHISPQCMYDDKFILNGKEAVIELLKREHIRAGTPTKLFRKELLLRFPFDEDAKSEDVHTMYKYFANAEKVVLYGIPKYHFIRHGNNNSIFTSDYNKLTSDILSEYIDAYQERRDYLIQKFPEEKAFWQYSVWSFYISMCEKIKMYKLADCHDLYVKMQIQLQESVEEINCSEYLKQWERALIEEKG